MNIIDKSFKQLTDEIKSLSEKELYYKIRKSFDGIPEETKISCSKFFNEIGYWGKLDLEKNNFEEIDLKSIELHNHIDDFIYFYSCLEDYRSKYTLYSILSNWYRYDFESTTKTKEYMYDDYFDLDILKCNNEEVFVDLGAYTGDTILSYIKNYGASSYKKIYCYEITPNIFDILKDNLKAYKNIDFRMKGVSNKLGNMSLVNNENSLSTNTIIEDAGDVIVTTLDEDIEEKITIIKSDIEGFEQKMIEGAKNHIINDHPKLLISIYHSNEDLWKIPKMIHELDSSYKFYLRYNSSPIYPTEITLYAI